MELIDYTSAWVKGEVFQGKIMIVLGLLFLLGFIAIFRSQDEFVRGLLIPFGLIVLVLIGYGGMQVTVRPEHVAKVESLAQENPQEALDKELAKSQNDHKVYSNIVKVWPLFIIAAIILFYLISSSYWKGFSVGIMILFAGMIILDSTLHHRLLKYLDGLNQLAA